MTPKLQTAYPRCLLTVEAEPDPQLPGRILGLFAQRGHLPPWFSARSSGDVLRIVIEVAEPDPEQRELIMKKILKIPTVLGVCLQPLRLTAEILA